MFLNKFLMMNTELNAFSFNAKNRNRKKKIKNTTYSHYIRGISLSISKFLPNSWIYTSWLRPEYCKMFLKNIKYFANNKFSIFLKKLHKLTSLKIHKKSSLPYIHMYIVKKWLWHRQLLKTLSSPYISRTVSVIQFLP